MEVAMMTLSSRLSFFFSSIFGCLEPQQTLLNALMFGTHSSAFFVQSLSGGSLSEVALVANV
jgi:hypothetical protein